MQPVDLSIRNLTVYVTEACNFQCSYCFQRDHSNPRTMDFGTSRRVVDWYLGEASGENRMLSYTFFGGEPLLEFELIRRTVEYGLEQAASCGKQIEFGATSNGSLFSRDVAAFWKEHNLSLLLSLDGAPASQEWRKAKNGMPSSALLEEAVPRILEAVPGVTVRMTVTPGNAAALVDNLEYLHSFGIRSFAHYPVERGWSAPTLALLDRAYRQAANWYLSKLADGERLFMGLYSLIARRLVEWRSLPDDERGEARAPCGAAKGYLGVAVDGSLYPCHRFVSLDDFRGRFRMGSVDEGLQERLRRQFIRITDRSMLGCAVSCRHCVAKPICLGGCLVQNLEMSGEMLMPMPDQQFISTMYYEIVSDMIRSVEQQKPELMPALLGQAGDGSGSAVSC